MKNNCPLCGRELGIFVNRHHLIPNTFSGKETVKLHTVCHDMIHRTFTERELIKYYHTIDRILENEEIQKFIKWIGKKPIDFYIKIKDTRVRKNKRKK
jgi:hypothetical protein